MRNIEPLIPLIMPWRFDLAKDDVTRIQNVHDNMKDLLSEKWEKDLCLSALIEAQMWANKQK